MKSRRMSKVSVFGSRKDMPEVIEELHSLGAYHILEHEAGEIDIGGPLESSSETAEALITAKSLLSSWKLKIEDDRIPKITRSEAIKKVTSIGEEGRNIEDKKNQISGEIENLEVAADNEKILSKLGIDSEYLDEVKRVDVFIGTVKDAGKLKDSIDAETKLYEMSSWTDEKGTDYIALISMKENGDAVGRILQQHGFNHFKLGHESFGDKERKRLSELKKEYKTLEKKQEGLVKDNEGLLKDAVLVLEAESEKGEAPLKFAVTENTFYIEGYVPEDTVEDMENKLDKITKGKIEVKELPLGNKDEVPIEMENPRAAEPFQFFMELYSLPKYTEIDPTLLTFITFPILFGIMLGDMGYGLLTLTMFLIGKRFAKKGTVIRQLLNILIMASIWTIIFGAFFGEAFGFDTIFGFHLPHVIHRLHDINDLLIMSLIVGVIHLNLGLLVGFYNEYKAHGLMEAVYEKLGWVVLQVAAALIGIAMMMGTIPMYYGFIVLALAVFMIFKGEGVRGMIELPAIFSNILSYARLMAIGLASAGLAVVVNQFATEFFQSGLGGIIPGVLILLLGHGINILLGLFGPFLHSLRLHYVEFFTKFYKGGGKPYKPFGTTWR